LWWISLNSEKKLVEEWLPFKEMNENARREMGFIRAPKISNLHLWPARRPTSVARILTLAALLPFDSLVKDKFNDLVKLNEIDEQPYKLLYLVNPEHTAIKDELLNTVGKSTDQVVVLDPMAGGGAIPLESLRLGFRTIAADYNPVAYLVLKATLEYPAKYGEKLYKDVKSEAEVFIEFAKKELSKYYAEDAHNYIIARGFQCPDHECKGIVPIIHGTRLGKNGPYIRFVIDKLKKEFEVKIVDEPTEYDRLKCPFCGRPFTNDEVFSQWVPKHKEILKIALDGDISTAEKYKEELLKTHILLVKQTPKGFVPCNEDDHDKFFGAYVDLAKQSNQLRQYLLNWLIPSDNQVFESVRELGINHWCELFNPRQLLILGKLVKYITEKNESLTKEHGEYGSAIALYLALGLNKIANFNNITTAWDDSTRTIRELVDHYARTRKIGLSLEYCEAKRLDLALKWVYEPHVEKIAATHGGVCPVVKQLCRWLQGLGDRIEVYMGDARELSKTFSEESIDLINVDPPYFNQHYYSDLSEFFWQPLSIAIKPSINAGFMFNRDKSKGRIECLVPGWNPSLPIMPRTGEIIVRKTKGKPDIVEFPFTKEWWREQMWRFFTETYKLLKNNGRLIVWYTHSDPEAWEAILGGLYASNLMISKVWTMRTEMAQRRVALVSSAFFTSMALIAKKRTTAIIVGERDLAKLVSNEQVKATIASSVTDTLKSAQDSGATNWELYTMALAGAIAGATAISNPSLETIDVSPETLNSYINKLDDWQVTKLKYGRVFQYFRESLYPCALYLGSSTVLQEYLERSGLSNEQISLIAAVDDITKAYLMFWLSTRYREKGHEPIITYDFAEKICKVLKTTMSSMESNGLIKKESKNVYSVMFGKEVLDNLRGKMELVDRTAATSSMFLFKLIIDSPIKDDEEKCAKQVISIKPPNKQTISVALFFLKTATEDELRKASISPLMKSFVERVLIALYKRR
jgi:adenine-specific DNA methylase